MPRRESQGRSGVVSNREPDLVNEMAGRRAREFYEGKKKAFFDAAQNWEDYFILQLKTRVENLQSGYIGQYKVSIEAISVRLSFVVDLYLSCKKEIIAYHRDNKYNDKDFSVALYLCRKRYRELIRKSALLRVLIRDIIEERDTFKFTLRVGLERQKLIDQFTSEFPGVPILPFLKRLFPEVQFDASVAASDGNLSALPTVAPAIWASAKQAGDTPPVFIKRHYEPWLGKGLARPDIKRLDKGLYDSLNNWLRHNEMPADVDLPTLKEKNDRWAERLAPGGDLVGSARDIVKASDALRSRQQRSRR
jgi:hypothetical protein